MEQQLGKNDKPGDSWEVLEKSDEENPIKTLQKSVDDIQEKQKKILEKLEELQTIRDEHGGKTRNSITDEEVLKVSNLNSGKIFVMKNVFENLSGMEIGDEINGETEEHFGCEWMMLIEKKEIHLAFYLICQKPLNSEMWTIDTEFECSLKSSQKPRSMLFNYIYNNEKGEASLNGCGQDEFLDWHEMMNDYCVDDKITVEVQVKINKMTGVYKRNLRRFDESMAEVSDVILIVNDQKFYVLKLFLATHSSYFKALFLGSFQESSKSEIVLTGIESEDFQKFLEVLYGDSAIDETTVEGIVLVADMFDTEIVIRKCEEFLIEKSQKSMKKKLQMSTRYNMNQLKKKCLSEINTVADIKSIIPGDPEDLDHSIMAALLQKLISLQ